MAWLSDAGSWINKAGGRIWDDLSSKASSVQDWMGGSGRTDNEFRAVDPQGYLAGQAGRAGQFAGLGQAGFAGSGAQMTDLADALRRRAQGEDSMSREQLNQGLMQGLSQQRAMAAGATPSNSAMAARNAALNMGQLSSGMSGQAALAGIQERSQAEQALANLLATRRAQDLQAALQSRANALQGYGTIEAQRGQRFGAITGVPTRGEQAVNLAVGALGAGAGMGD